MKPSKHINTGPWQQKLCDAWGGILDSKNFDVRKTPIGYSKDITIFDHIFPMNVLCRNKFWDLSICNISKEITGKYRSFFDSGVDFCFVNRIQSDYIFNYTLQFFKNYENDPKFAYLHLYEGHFYYPIYKQLIDGYLVRFFQNLKNNKVFEDTLVVLMGDHGFQYGEYYHSFDGYFENKHPFLMFSAPNWFMESSVVINEKLELVESLGCVMRRNSNKLVTTMDINFTLENYLKKEMNEKADKSVGKHKRNLFEIIEDRECKDVNVDDFFCI